MPRRTSDWSLQLLTRRCVLSEVREVLQTDQQSVAVELEVGFGKPYRGAEWRSSLT
jgi:hypothetical protein